MLLLEMLRRTNRITCKRYTRREERKSGADWLWWFVSGNQGFPMLIQAKRLYSSGRYEALKYKKGSRHDQTNTLLRTARNNDWLPLFCFYNSPPHLQSPFWGCALASAQSVKHHLLRSNQQGNDIDSILPVSVPWWYLVCLPDHSEASFPDAVSRRVMQIFEIETPPAIRELPLDVLRLLSRVPDEDHLEPLMQAKGFEQNPEPSGDRDSIAGIIVVSDQPIEGRA